MKTYKENYPTGKKHCSRCRRWRVLVDFQVRRWTDEPLCTVAQTLSSLCTPCMAGARRARVGGKPREHYPHGRPGSPSHKKHVLECNRLSAAKRRQDKDYRDALNEYHRIWRNAKSGSVARSAKDAPTENVGIDLDGKALAAYLKKFITVVPVTVLEDKPGRTTRFKQHLNGKPLSTEDQAYLADLKRGSVKRPRLERADEFASRYELPLWEIEEAAAIKDDAA